MRNNAWGDSNFRLRTSPSKTEDFQQSLRSHYSNLGPNLFIKMPAIKTAGFTQMFKQVEWKTRKMDYRSFGDVSPKREDEKRKSSDDVSPAVLKRVTDKQIKLRQQMSESQISKYRQRLQKQSASHTDNVLVTSAAARGWKESNPMQDFTISTKKTRARNFTFRDTTLVTAVYDADANGIIDKEELAEILCDLQLPNSHADVASWMSRLDQNCSGTVGVLELYRSIPDVWARDFKAADLNRLVSQFPTVGKGSNKHIIKGGGEDCNWLKGVYEVRAFQRQT